MRTITPSNIHALSLREQGELENEAIRFGIAWNDIYKIKKRFKAVTYWVYLRDESGKAYLVDGEIAHVKKKFRT